MRGRDINIDIDAGRSETLTIKPVINGGEPWDFGSQTVSGELRDVRTDELVEALACGVTEEGLIVVDFPVMDGGQYVFAVDMSGPDGGSTRLIDGYVTYGEPKAVIEGGEETEDHCLTVYVDEKTRKAVWSWSKEAERMYEAAKIQAEKAAESADKAEKAANSVNQGVQVTLLGEIAEALKDFESKAGKVIVANTTTNTWWIAGVDTGVQLTGDKGDNGFSPYINALGNWVSWNEDIGAGEDTKIKAQGKDGIDGDAIRRVVVDKLPETPKNESEAKAHRGIFYFVSGVDGYDTYALLETADGTFTWVNVGDSNAFASDVLYGIVKLGTGAIISGEVNNGDFAPVGTSAGGGLAVAKATDSQAGVVVKSLSLWNRADKDVPTVNAVRAWLDEYHYEKDDVNGKIDTVINSIASVNNELGKLIDEVGTNELNIEILQEVNQKLSSKFADYPTKGEVEDAINAAYDDIVDEVKQEMFIEMTADEYAKVTNPIPGKLYLIPEE